MREKIFLTENLLSSYGQRYLLEFQGDNNTLKKAMENPDIPIDMVGLLQKGDTPNRNRRIYPFPILKKECVRYLGDEVKEKQSFGELDHPDESVVPSLERAAMAVEDLWFSGNEVNGKVRLLNAFMPQSALGLIARGIVLNGKVLGISSRALGSVYPDENGYDVVDEDLEIICWDLVSKPSTIGSNLKAANKLTVKESRILKESVNNPTKTVRKIIKENFNLTPEQKLYLDILGVEKFLQLTQI